MSPNDIKNLTKEKAQELFWHDTETGDLHRVAMSSTNGKPPMKNGKELKEWLMSNFNRDQNNSYPFSVRAKKDSHGRKYYISGVKLHGHKYMILVHRIIWNIHYGKIPKGMIIDHINNDSLDNRIENLQCITQSENIKRNKKTDTQIQAFEKYCRQPVKSGVKGLYTDGSKQYIRLPSGKRKYLTDDNKEELMGTL